MQAFSQDHLLNSQFRKFVYQELKSYSNHLPSYFQLQLFSFFE